MNQFPNPHLSNQDRSNKRSSVRPEFESELAELNKLFASKREPSDSTEDRWPQIMTLAYRRLHSIARNLVGYPIGDPTLGPTALVNEGFAKLFQSSDLEGIENAAHFYCRFAQCMKHILVDYARSKATEKGGGNMRRVDLDIVLASLAKRPEQLLEINEALERLYLEAPRAAKALELQVFGRMTIAEIEAVNGVCDSTVEADLRFAKAYVRRMLA
jgi:RNA polymerase sigma factor (TIGR02999 family)